MPGAAVTRKEFTDALRNVDMKIGTNSKAIQVVDERGRSLAAAQGRMAADLRKEMVDRKKAIMGVRKDLQSTRETGILLSLLPSLGVGGNNIGILAPLLLLGNDVSGEPPSSGTSGGILGGLGGGGGGLGGIVPLLLISELLKDRTAGR